MIPYGRQTIEEDDIAAVVAVLRSDLLTQGPAVEEFEIGVGDSRHGDGGVRLSAPHSPRDHTGD